MILLSSEAISDIDRLRTFLEVKNPSAAARAIEAIWKALEIVEQFPALGLATEAPSIRQIVVPFGSSAYIVRYRVLDATGSLYVTRIWHGREAR